MTMSKTQNRVLKKHEHHGLRSSKGSEIVVSFMPRQIVGLFLVIMIAVVLMHLITQGIRYFSGHDTLLGIRHQFDLGEENNIPTWYASSVLFLCSALLVLIWHRSRQLRERYALHWLALCILFLCLSVDEAASLHEMVGLILHDVFHFTGYLYYAWVIPGVFFVVIAGLSFFRFVLHLPMPIRGLFLCAGFLYVGGALGVEMLGSNEASIGGNATAFYSLVLIPVEEGMEMLGTIVFLYALCSYLTVPVKIVFGT